eukprot:c2571_g1_i1.p1 GENE.c2571_g1_i1~~c2571_g1_i1.p1  ORF type:complete len:558 (+),score=116.00 c2571_g1_i1:34-1707(+)
MNTRAMATPIQPVLFILVLLALTDATTVETSRKLSQIRQMSDAVQRYRYDSGKFVPVSKGFCAYPTTSDGSCDWEIYDQEVMIFGSVGIILACLLIIFWVAFWLARRFCNCCGGMEATSARNLCFVNKDQSTFNGYTAFQIWLPKIVIWLMMLATFILLCIGWVNNEDSRKSIAQFGRDIHNQGHEIHNELVQQNTSITQSYNLIASSNAVTLALPNITTTLAVAVASSKLTITEADTDRDLILHFDMVRFSITHFTFFLCFAALIAGTIASLCNLPRVSLAASQFAMFGLVLVLIVLGFHYAFTIVTVDLCDEMEKLVPVQKIPAINSTLGILLACDKPVRMATFTAATDDTEELRQTALFSGCSVFLQNQDKFQTTTSEIVNACSVWTNGSRPFTLQQGRNIANTSCTPGQSSAPWQTCDSASRRYKTVYPQISNLQVSSSCSSDPTCQSAVENMKSLFNTVANDLDLSVPVLTNISTCEKLVELVAKSQTLGCDRITRNVDAVWGVALGLIFTIGIGSTMMLLGYKRFDEENARAGFIPKYHFKRASRVRPFGS